MKHDISYFNRSRYLSYYKNCKLKDDVILLESQQGKNLNGNIFYLLKELVNNQEYKNYKIYLSVTKKAKNSFSNLLSQYQLTCNLVEIGSRNYYKLLASSKYLITDTSFTPAFIKKDGQIIFNVWHGTPFKTLGRKDNSGLHSLGNVQKNFVVADYLLYPNTYMMNHMIEDYMLENLSDAECVLGGYPRNEVFFKEKNVSIIDELEANDKQIIGYMPTWRGTVGRVNEIEEPIHVMHYLFEIDKKLNENQLMLVNLHPFVQSEIEFNRFKHILPFPKQYETYEVLNICDVLITDYSSVFFDFANTKRKIILFMYDVEEYLVDRGLYLSLDDLPFPKVYCVKDLINEINSDKNYDDQQFLDTYCFKDNINASSMILKYLFKSEINQLEIKKIPHNNKENVLIYSGNLAKNGITTALFNLLNSIDTTKYNYFITFSAKRVAPHKKTLYELPQNVNYIPILGKMNATLFQKLVLYFSKKIKLKYDYDKKLFDEMYKYEIKRCFGNIKFSSVVQYSGYEFKNELMFGRFDCKRIIFVHNNMIQEVQVRHAQNRDAITYAYNNYDKVVLVTEDMREPTMHFCNDESKLCIANNIIDYDRIISKSKENPTFDDNTSSTESLDRINDILNSSAKKFITIGRFSPEKGHKRLIESFNKLWMENNDIYLIIIGGHGVLYQETIDLAKSMESSDHIIIIKSLLNPYPFLKKCDYFVFSSFHEGFGLVLVEADILGLPVLSTDILGPRGFLKEHNGLLVENNADGIYFGMKQMLDGKIKNMNVDYSEYNRNAVKQFEKLIND